VNIYGHIFKTMRARVLELTDDKYDVYSRTSTSNDFYFNYFIERFRVVVKAWKEKERVHFRTQSRKRRGA